jgi:hypothetical protein
VGSIIDPPPPASAPPATPTRAHRPSVGPMFSATRSLLTTLSARAAAKARPTQKVRARQLREFPRIPGCRMSERRARRVRRHRHPRWRTRGYLPNCQLPAFGSRGGAPRTIQRKSEPEPACKPDSVDRLRDPAVIPLGRRLPAGSSDLYPEAWGEQPASLFGLAPGGVYRASAVTGGSGELLPHRFTLAATRRNAAVCSLWHFPRLAAGRR